MSLKMSDTQIEAFVTDCLSRVKESNKDTIATKIKEWDDNPSKSKEDIKFEALELLMDVMYATVGDIVTSALCEYNRNN